jgi:hypothetical protein
MHVAKEPPASSTSLLGARASGAQRVTSVRLAVSYRHPSFRSGWSFRTKAQAKFLTPKGRGITWTWPLACGASA